MSLLLAALLYGGVFTGYVFNDKVVQPYIQQQINHQSNANTTLTGDSLRMSNVIERANKKEDQDWPVDLLGMKVEIENEMEFERLK